MRHRSVWLYIGAVIFSVIFLFPIYVLILITFVPNHFTIDAFYPSLIPKGFTLFYLVQSIKTLDLLSPVLRSLGAAFIVGGLAVALGIPAGYGLSKLTARISNKIVVLMFLVNMMPGLVVAIPIATYFIKVNLYNDFIGVGLAQELVVLPVAVFIILGGFRALPKDLENQALVDGASMWTSLGRVLIPLNRAPIFVAFLLSWMTSWDEFTYAVIVSPADPTFPVKLYNYISRGEPSLASAFALIVTVPVIIIAAILQKYLKGQYLSGGMI